MCIKLKVPTSHISVSCVKVKLVTYVAPLLSVLSPLHPLNVDLLHEKIGPPFSGPKLLEVLITAPTTTVP